MHSNKQEQERDKAHMYTYILHKKKKNEMPLE